MKNLLFLIILFISGCFIANSQHVGSSPEYIKSITPEWKGERLPDGRPKVPDSILERLRNISVEEAWGVLHDKGFMNQFESDWIIIHPDQAMTGRVVTAQYLPLRPDMDKIINLILPESKLLKSKIVDPRPNGSAARLAGRTGAGLFLNQNQ